MTLFKIAANQLKKVERTTFQAERILERENLQQMFRVYISAIVPNAMVLSEEYANWEGSRRRIDLLCIDKNARLLVVELKRTEDGGHMELQAIRYASMISTMSFNAAVQAHRDYLDRQKIEGDAEEIILKFLEWDEPQDDFGEEVSIVLVSGDFSQELMSSVIWLSHHDIDIRCVALRPYTHNGELLIDIEQRFPLPEASDYQIRIREKERQERQAREQNRDFTRFDLQIGEDKLSNLPKRQLIYNIVKEAIGRGAAPRDVMELNKAWIILLGEHDEDSFVAHADDREQGSSLSEVGRFYTGDDELFYHGGKTYAFTKMWGSSTRSKADEIIERYEMNNVHYSETSEI